MRPVTMKLVRAIQDDLWPEGAAVKMDFGLSSQRHYEALYYPLRAGHITPAQLDNALGSGPKLTELAKAPSNPHQGIIFVTAWDNLGEEEYD